MPAVLSQRCPIDRLPAHVHARCWSCGQFAGDRHLRGPLVLGLCQVCRHDLAQATSTEAFLHRLSPSFEPLEDELLDTADVAGMFKVKPKTVRNWAAIGKLTPAKTAGRLRFRRGDLR